MTGILEIEEMEFFAYHGCFEAEQTVGNKFKVYACLHYNCDKAAVSDQITDALSYQTAYEIIAVEMMKRSHLLEHVGLAQRIMDDIIDLELEKIEKIMEKIDSGKAAEVLENLVNYTK